MVTVCVVGPAGLDGVPLITQVEVLIDKPAGRAGEIVQLEIFVPPL